MRVGPSYQGIFGLEAGGLTLDDAEGEMTLSPLRALMGMAAISSKPSCRAKAAYSFVIFSKISWL